MLLKAVFVSYDESVQRRQELRVSVSGGLRRKPWGRGGKLFTFFRAASVRVARVTIWDFAEFGRTVGSTGLASIRTFGRFRRISTYEQCYPGRRQKSTRQKSTFKTARVKTAPRQNRIATNNPRQNSRATEEHVPKWHATKQHHNKAART